MHLERGIPDAENAQHPAARFARLDFAGQERDIFPDRVAFAVNLLRGDQIALDMLDERCDRVVHGRWLELKEQGRQYAPLGLPILGVTCHAGEDYAHPLEGIHAMYTAVKALRMRAGDSLGHGLALGRDVREFHKDFADSVLTEAGGQFDAILWLRRLLIEKAPPACALAIAQLESWLWKEAAELYPPYLVPKSLAAFEMLAEYRAGPVPDRSGSRGASEPERLWYAENWGAGRHKTNPVETRSRRVPLAPVLFQVEGWITWAQEQVALALAERGVVIEINPSSNWRMTQARTPGQIPCMMALTRFRNMLLACINSDNAGLYGTRIENEYSIVAEALRERGLTRRETLAVLEELRLNGLRLLA